MKIQIYGILLAVFTAIGSIAYEKIVHTFSFRTFIVIRAIEVALFSLVGFFIFNENDTSIIPLTGIFKFNYLLWIFLYIISGVTTLFWFEITKESSVLQGAVFEMKYLPILSLVYIIFGDAKMTMNTCLGILFAIISIYFITK